MTSQQILRDLEMNFFGGFAPEDTEDSFFQGQAKQIIHIFEKKKSALKEVGYPCFQPKNLTLKGVVICVFSWKNRH